MYQGAGLWMKWRWWKAHLHLEGHCFLSYSLLQPHLSKEKKTVPVRNTHIGSTCANSVTFASVNKVTETQLPGNSQVYLVGLEWG